jgi:hypothetical protein
MKILTPLLLLLLTFSHAFADDNKTDDKVINDKAEETLQKYDVNIIIFEDAHARYLNAEQWNTARPVTDEEQSSNLKARHINTADTEAENPEITDFENIPPKILNHEYKRIKASSQYNIMFYGSWRQTGLDKNNAYKINIEQQKNQHPTKSKNSISGYFELVLARYLHMYGQLEYHRAIEIPTTDISSTEIAVLDMASSPAQQETDTLNENNKQPIYTIKLHRKMRSKTLHYIDHPMVGILLQINPTENKAEEE